MDTLTDKWDEILLSVKEEYEIADISFKTWLKPLEVFSVEDNVLYLLFPSEESDQISLNYISKKYSLPLKVTITEFTGKEYELKFILPKEASTLKPEKTRAMQPLSENRAKSNLNMKYTFDTFVVGNSNKFAHTAALAVAESPGESYNPLYIYGGPGLGKTHLMHSIGNFILNEHPDMKVLYVTSEEFTNEVIESIRNTSNTSSMSIFREKYRTVDVLMIDDIQFIIGKESTQEEFFHTFNSLYQAGKQIVLTSDRPPKEIKTLEERLRTRFEWGLIADIQPPDFETRIAIIKRKAELLDLDIPNVVEEYIANHVKNNIRQLEGVVKKLNAYNKLAQTPPSILLAQSAIREILTDNQPIPVTVERIISEVGRTFGVSAEDIRSSKRSSQISNARQIAMYVIREITQMSMAAIGNEFGGRDHSTVVYATGQVVKNMKQDTKYKETVEDIIKNIRDA